MSRGNKIRLTIVIGLVLFIVYIYFLAFIFSGKTCAKVVGIESIGALGKDNGYTIEYYIDDEKYVGGKSKGFFKADITYDGLRKIECIEIEYSDLTSSLFKVVDNRVLAD